jgi:hypothetical protein
MSRVMWGGVQVRNWLMPINRKYKLDTLMQALREEFPRQHENSRGQGKVFFEYLYGPRPLSGTTPLTPCDTAPPQWGYTVPAPISRCRYADHTHHQCCPCNTDIWPFIFF